MSLDNEALAKSMDELDLEIGRALLGDALGSKKVSDRELRSTARRWFEANLANFKVAVCSNEIVQSQLIGKANKTRNELFAAVADALMKIGGIAVPLATLSAKLVHYGLEKLCAVPTD